MSYNNDYIEPLLHRKLTHSYLKQKNTNDRENIPYLHSKIKAPIRGLYYKQFVLGYFNKTGIAIYLCYL